MKVYRKGMSVVIELSTYPLLQGLPDPERVLRSWIDEKYAIFSSQQKGQPSDELVQSVKTMCQSLSETTDSMQEQMMTMELRHRDHLVKVESSLNQLPILLAKSQTRGTLGESSLREYLTEMLPANEYILESTAKTAHSGDLLIRKRDISILCDAKLYSKSVPKKEVEKLKQDMMATDTRLGMLISFNSGVSGYANTDFVVFRNEVGHLYCLVVLGCVKSFPQTILLCIHVLESLHERVLKEDTIPMERETQSKSVLDLIMTSAERLTMLNTSFVEMQEGIESSLQKQKDVLMRAIIGHQEQVRAYMSVL